MTELLSQLDGLPWPAKIIAFAVMGLWMAARMIRSYTDEKAKPAEPVRNVIIPDAGIMDLSPLRDAATQLKRIADTLDEMKDAAERRAKERTSESIDRLTEQMEDLRSIVEDRGPRRR